MNILDSYMQQKGQEYRKFNPNRAKNIYTKLKCALRDSAYIPPKKVIQVIGTNGKGSTGRFLTLALIQHNNNVVHFTSPHIFNFNERFYKNGKIVSDNELLEAHEILQEFDFMREASYFEYATFLAYILSNGVDYLILEAGVGGEFDSTSVIERDMCIVSVIDFDHEEMLGNNIEAIATTKLNAMVSPSIIGFQKHNIVIQIADNIAIKNDIRLIVLDSDDILQYGVCGISYSAILHYITKHNLATFLIENLILSLKALEILGLDCDLENLAKLDLKGRFERILDNVIIDVGHNQSAATALKNSLKDKKVILVYNSYFQKNIKNILHILQDNIIRVEILDITDNDRIVKREVLEEILESLNISYNDFKGINKEYEYLVFGSFSVVEKFMLTFVDY